MKYIIEIEQLNKSFGEVKAVQDLSFHVKEGELFAFLGVNGAGKSTTISILCGQLAKDSGTVTVDGRNIEGSPEAVKEKLGVVFQNSVLDKALSVRDNLKSRAALYGITGKDFEQRLSELAGLLDFGDLLKRPVGKLSGGQRRRIQKTALGCSAEASARRKHDGISDHSLYGRGSGSGLRGNSGQRQNCGGGDAAGTEKYLYRRFYYAVWCESDSGGIFRCAL